MTSQLRISGYHYNLLKQHLLPTDGKEAVAVALCGRYHDSSTNILLVHDITLIPYDDCRERESNLLHWSTNHIQKYFDTISRKDFAILKIHSHPGGYENFSKADNKSDYELFDSAFGWSVNDFPHGSAIMLPDGKIIGRLFFNDMHCEPIDKISVIGDSILYFSKAKTTMKQEFAMRTIQAFGELTYNILSNMTVGVVGCSGTGSLVIEQLVRLGVGKIIICDPDIIEKKNLNRIINSTMNDAEGGIAKVSVISNAIKKMGLGTKVIAYKDNIYNDKLILKELVKCDMLFGCVDSIDGRYLLNQLATFYLLPYFDLGVKLEADGNGGINKICGSVHYIQPNMSSLLTRGVFTLDDLKASSQLRKNPHEYNKLRKNKYISNVNVDNPAVISVNMLVASHAINEFLNRIHPYRAYSAQSILDITENYISDTKEDDLPIDIYLRKYVGRGDITPFIEMPEI